MCAAPTDDRDARHLSLQGLGADGVARLHAAHLLIVGVGGTGHAAASLLAAAGVGALTLVDFDRVDASNLARQVLFTPQDIGEAKADVAARALRRQHPGVTVHPVCERLTGPALSARIAGTDATLDCTDNFASRFVLNEACVETGRALISGSAIRWEGQVAVFGPDYDRQPCYRCLYAEDDESLDDCQGSGVAGPLPAAVGALMAVEAIKLIAGVGRPLTLSLYDALSGEWRQLAVPKRSGCPVCASAN